MHACLVQLAWPVRKVDIISYTILRCFVLFPSGSLQNAFEALRDLAVENGAEPGIEMIQMREKDKIILFGLPGTLEKMKVGSFPPPPLPPREEEAAAQP